MCLFMKSAWKRMWWTKAKYSFCRKSNSDRLMFSTIVSSRISNRVPEFTFSVVCQPLLKQLFTYINSRPKAVIYHALLSLTV